MLEQLVLRGSAGWARIGPRAVPTVGQEHFASNLLRGRLLGLARGWGSGGGSLAILACPPGEAHDLGLIAFGLALRAQDWRIAFLGVDTPLFDDRRDRGQRLAPRRGRARLDRGAPDCARSRRRSTALAAEHALFLGGAGANRRFASRVGAQVARGRGDLRRALPRRFHA